MRSQKVDFFRGIALIIIFIDHVYNNRLGGYTLRGFGVTDAAEIFFFCSGFVSALVYSKVIQRGGVLSAQLKATLRSLYIYFFHIISFLLLITITFPLLDYEGVNVVLRVRGLYEFFYSNWTIGLYIFTLQYQPFLFTILPAYIVLSLMTPFFTWLLGRSPVHLFTVSLTIYILTQLFPEFNLVQGQNNTPWIFNPFAYQFLFVIGMLFGQNSKTERFKIPMRKGIVSFAILLLLAIFIFHNLIPFLYKHYHIFATYPYLNGLPLTGKTNESPLRIIHFLILFYVTIFFLSQFRLTMPVLYQRLKKLARPIVLCGQNSIYIFTLGILLSYLGGYIIASYGNSASVWVPVNISGVTIMLWAASRIARSKHLIQK